MIVSDDNKNDHLFLCLIFGCHPFSFYVYIISRYAHIYNDILIFFRVLFTNREYNSGNFRTTPCFCLHIVNNLQNTKCTKYKIFRRLQNTKYKIYFIS